jgi:hypothetical protein
MVLLAGMGVAHANGASSACANLAQGKPPTESGNTTLAQGKPPTESGNTTLAQGKPPTESGNTTRDLLSGRAGMRERGDVGRGRVSN